MFYSASVRQPGDFMQPPLDDFCPVPQNKLTSIDIVGVEIGVSQSLFYDGFLPV